MDFDKYCETGLRGRLRGALSEETIFSFYQVINNCGIHEIYFVLFVSRQF